MSREPWFNSLLQAGWIEREDAVVTPLCGGVSSDIFLIEDGSRQYVVKRALPRLRVKEPWFADISRNAVEQAYIEYVGRILPENVPRILFCDPDAGLFGMEYLGGEFSNWKSELMRGVVRDEDARRAGKILGAVHRASWNDPRARENFATGANFFALRIEPYLIVAGRRNPALRETFEAEAERLQRTPGLALVHGDYSPKNLLVSPKRLVILDCEVACYGDPAFDLAFLLNHFLLKALHRPAQLDDYLRLAGLARQEYAQALGEQASENLEARTERLLLMLLLARVDGKSPAEYLTDSRDHQLIREFVLRWLPGCPVGLDEITREWGGWLRGQRS